VRLFHDDLSGGHWGVQKTLNLLRRHFIWGEINSEVRDYVSSKAVHRRKLSGKLKPLPIPYNVAIDLVKEISLNWIAGLPESRKKNTRLCFYSILTIVDRLIKYALFIPTWDDTSAADFAQQFFEHVECRFGIPRSIVSDRDSRITSEFWREVCEYNMLKRARQSITLRPMVDQNR